MPCPVTGNAHVRVNDRNPTYLRIAPMNHRIPIRGIDFRGAGTGVAADNPWTPAQRSGGAWHITNAGSLARGGTGIVLRLTSAQGEVIESTEIIPTTGANENVDLGVQFTDQDPSSGGTCEFLPPALVYGEEYGGIDEMRWIINAWGAAENGPNGPYDQDCFAGESCLRVRDLDDEGRMLWVDGTKTERARRHLEVPASLQPFLRQAAHGRFGDAFLFGESRNGGPRSRHVLHQRVKALCKSAGVTRVCPHSLRGLWATLQARAGADPNAIARSLGHGSFEITRRHYAQASALHGAQSERVTAILARPSTEQAPLRAEDVLKKLPADTIEELRTLLLQSPGQSIRNPPTGPMSGDFSTEIH